MIAERNPQAAPSFMWFGFGVGVGLACFAFLDPHRGAARRARLRDRTLALGRDLREDLRRRAFDLEWRARGKAHQAKARLTEHEVDDEILAERVRAQIGRPVSHPRVLEVIAEAGVVTLRGPILADEVEGLLRRVKKIRGVHVVHNELDVHQTPDIRALQTFNGRQSRR